jgi:small GTP-binding protein
MPHQEMRRLIKRRIQGLDPKERTRVLRAALDELPGYYSGPYGELRRWVEDQIREATTRRGAEHHDQYFIARQGAAQVVLAGPPNAGKSSLLAALTGRGVRVGDYAFTTTRPAEGMLVLHGASLQIIDLPGLIEGGVEGRGDGRAVLATIRMADAIVFTAPVSPDGEAALDLVRGMVLPDAPGKPHAVVGTKWDVADQAAWDRFQNACGGAPRVRCSVVTGEGMDAVRKLIWDLTGLMRVYPKPRGKPVSPTPVVLPAGATVEDLVRAIHRDWVAAFRVARVTGASARFPGQVVGLSHVLLDGDSVEVTVDA